MASSVRSFRVEDRREKPFFTVDNQLITEVLGKVSSDTVVLYLVLAHHEEEGGGELSYDEIASRMGVLPKTVMHGVSELMRIGILQKDGKGWSIGFPEGYHA